MSIVYHRTLGQRASDAVAEFCGSWAFIAAFSAICVGWVFDQRYNPFDPYPFIALNLMLTVVSTFQSPLIMMAQNRQADRDREAVSLVLEKLEQIEKLMLAKSREGK